MRKLMPFAAVVYAAGLVAGAAAEDKKKAPDLKLEGGYTIVSGEKNGKEIPVGEIEGSTVRFTADKITGTDKNKKDFFAATYALDTSKTPAVITMKSTEPKEATAVGLVKKEGDTVTLIYALPGVPAPTEFKTKDGQMMFVMKNLNPGPKK